jgi:hypothetical protein
MAPNDGRRLRAANYGSVGTHSDRQQQHQGCRQGQSQHKLAHSSHLLRGTDRCQPREKETAEQAARTRDAGSMAGHSSGLPICQPRCHGGGFRYCAHMLTDALTQRPTGVLRPTCSVRTLSPPGEELRNQRLEVVDPVLALRREPTPVIGARAGKLWFDARDHADILASNLAGTAESRGRLAPCHGWEGCTARITRQKLN